ncbi:cytochrome p450 [Fusarium sporotrichioides]|uniref:Cytochrome p450 n=1 Tax=Fusarium sporotrichioides TaxID=5514 RepID=A0A395RVP9_FUSSP|nr:cytochrome p450 [Fusarium sporotrichioides]
MMKRKVPCEPSDDGQPSKKRGPSSRPPRASQACRSCASSKVRCDDLDICRRCLKRGVPCVRPTPVGQGHRTVAAEEPRASSVPSTKVSDNRDESCILASTIHDFAEVPPSLIAPISPVARDENSGDLTNTTFAFPDSPVSLGPSILPQPCSDVQSINSFTDIPLTDATEWLKNAPLHAEFDTSFLLPLPFFDLYGSTEETPIEGLTDVSNTSSKILLPQDKAGFEEAVIAYKTTLGSWKPTGEDYLAAARASLHVPLDEQVRLGDGLGHLNSSVVHGYLSPARRDEIIVAVIGGTQTAAQSLLAVRMFPSAEILDKFLKIFLTDQETSDSAFIHIPTFDPSTCSLSLLIACIAAGAASSPNPSARKFGLGLSDVLRLYLAASAEQENILTRDLSHIQSLMILSETGLWSGDKRLSELSDFLSELTTSMLRHAGRFLQHSYLSPTIMLEALQSELDDTWTKWAQQESLKR